MFKIKGFLSKVRKNECYYKRRLFGEGELRGVSRGLFGYLYGYIRYWVKVVEKFWFMF